MSKTRLSREVTKVTSALTQADSLPRRQTRSFAASLQGFAYNDGSPQPIPLKTVKTESSNEDESSLSSPASGTFDIEDTIASAIGKRKRGANTASTAVTAVSTTSSTRTSPRKNTIKDEGGTVAKPKKAKRQPAKRIVNPVGEEEVQPPANWEEIYDLVREMRKTKVAPVDTMGCETIAEEHRTPRDRRFQTLIALMLSSQTKDTTNALAMRRLQTELPSPGLTLENILAVDPIRLNELIYAVGFHNNKTKYIKAAALILRDDYAGDIPDTVEGLMSLPGVGPKMAYLCLSAAWGRTEGIGVDVHVHRITNLWGWHKTRTPEETRAQLEAWLPRERWHEINHLLVGFGQTVCLPVGRKCGECTLSERGLCPAAVVEKKKHKKVVKKIKKEGLEGRDELGLELVANEETVVVKEEDVVAADVG